VLDLINKYEELYKISKNYDLKNMIIMQIINHQKLLKSQPYEIEEPMNIFIKNEKIKIDFVDGIEKEFSQLKGKRMLDIGCGKGGILVSSAQRGANVVGFDIDKYEIKIAKLRVEESGLDNVLVFKGDCRHIPLHDNYFDIVTITGVLEHVNDIENVIKEIVRVIKPNGLCLISTPNPFYPREGHYKIFWVPYLPKKLGEIYLRMRGRNPAFFNNSVTYPYPSIPKIQKLFKKNRMEVRNITEEVILAKFNDPQVIENERIRKVIKVLRKLGVNNLTAKLIISFHFYPGARIIAMRGKL
jgi:ubiquinone biosynthesis O-methyltransferase